MKPYECPHETLEPQERVAPGLLRCRQCGGAGYVMPDGGFVRLEELERLSLMLAEQNVRDHAEKLKEHR